MKPHGTDSAHPDTVRNGVTLLEVLCVMLIVSVFAALVFPGITALNRSAKRRLAAATAASLVIGMQEYRARYGNWPALLQESDGDVVYAPDDGTCTVQEGTLLEQAVCIGALTTNRLLNPRQELFIETETESISAGRLLDPWGAPYVIVVDNNADRIIDITMMHASGNTLSLSTNAECIALSWGNEQAEPVFSFSTN